MENLKTLLSIFWLTAISQLQGDVLIRSYANDHEFAYTYGAWLDQVKSGPSGVQIGPNATARGGAGNYFKIPIDLSGESVLELTIRSLPGNAVQNLNVLLRTRFGPGDNDFYSSRYSLLIPKSASEAYVKVQLPLGTRKATSGEFGPVNLTSVNEVQIQGNYASDSKALHLSIWEVRATRPSTLN
jgi:hypothetical protein